MIKEDLGEELSPHSYLSTFFEWQVKMQENPSKSSYSVWTNLNHLEFIAKLRSFKIYVSC